MPKSMQTVTDKLIAGNSFSKGDDELFLYLTLTVSTIFAGVMHVFLLISMALFEVQLLVVFNIISILVYASLLLLVITRKTYRFAGAIITAEVTLHALFATLYLGQSCNFFLYLFLIQLLQLNVPYVSTKMRIVNSSIVFVAMIISVSMGYFIEPFYKLSDETVLAFSVFNSILCFVGILIELLAMNIISHNHTERVRTYEKRAHTDSLTGIFNRWYADGFIADFALRTEEGKWCVAIMDVDDFKQVNDTLGHPAGDEVLRSLSNLLITNFRKTDVLFRWGGEEFLIFLSNVDLETAADILDVVRKRIAETPVFAANTTIEYTVTIGVAPVDLNDVHGSIAICDERLYWGKQHGKNQVVS